MNKIVNERGGALLIVFFILILFMVLGLSISSFLVQGGKQRAFADDEIQGKMFADMGLAYFKKQLEKELNDVSSPIKTSGYKNSTVVDTFVSNKLDEVASKITLVNNAGPYQRYTLPGENRGGFALGYKIEPVALSYINDPQQPSQPYVKKITLYALGLPPRAINETGKAKRILLTSTIYINTVPAPFHYAVSSPKGLRLFGGTNIIGNAAAGNVLVSKDYRYLVENEGKTGTDDPNDLGGPKQSDRNQPYIDGTLFLSDAGELSMVDAVPKPEPDPNSENFSNVRDITPLNRTTLKSVGIFTPKELPVGSTKTELSAPKEMPYVPGYEPPIVERVTEQKIATTKLTFDPGSPSAPAAAKETVHDFIKEKMINDNQSHHAGPSDFEVSPDKPISFEQGGEDGFDIIKNIPPLSDKKLVIRSEPLSITDPNAPVPLTVRLSGQKLINDVRQLYIGPSDTMPDGKATVEMGHLAAFKDGVSGEPFTFEGTIYIKGNLDIVGNIDIKGTIYVDGDVVIREIENINNKNLAIIASGKINLTARNIKQDSETMNAYLAKWKGEGTSSFKPLSAFLYSESALHIYSINSFNRIYGGVATGDQGYLEFNTKRELTQEIYKDSDPNYLASRFTIQFNRKIFEDNTYGLPAGDTFFLDAYDIEYNPKGSMPSTVQFVP